MLEQFGPVVDRFVAVLTRILPDMNPQQLFWRVHFMIGTRARSTTATALS